MITGAVCTIARNFFFFPQILKLMSARQEVICITEAIHNVPVAMIEFRHFLFEDVNLEKGSLGDFIKT